jgi:hypothetical protein
MHEEFRYRKFIKKKFSKPLNFAEQPWQQPPQTAKRLIFLEKLDSPSLHSSLAHLFSYNFSLFRVTRNAIFDQGCSLISHQFAHYFYTPIYSGTSSRLRLTQHDWRGVVGRQLSHSGRSAWDLCKLPTLYLGRL